jgi:hypothetical protein
MRKCRWCGQPAGVVPFCSTLMFPPSGLGGLVLASDLVEETERAEAERMMVKLFVWLGEMSWLASIPEAGIGATADCRSEAMRRARRMYSYASYDARDLVVVDGPPMEERA